MITDMNTDLRADPAPRENRRRQPLDELVERHHHRSIQAIERGVRHLIRAIRARRRRTEENAS